MLEERFRLLEEKITALLGELKRIRQENAGQKAELHTLREIADENERIQEENASLRARVEELEQISEAGTAKEESVRERLRQIIEKIDAIESMPEVE